MPVYSRVPHRRRSGTGSSCQGYWGAANIGVCRVPVFARDDRGRGPLVPAQPVLPRRRGAAPERGIVVDHVTVYRLTQRFRRHDRREMRIMTRLAVHRPPLTRSPLLTWCMRPLWWKPSDRGERGVIAILVGSHGYCQICRRRDRHHG